MEVAQVLLEAGAKTEAKDKVRARRGGERGGSRVRNGVVFCFSRESCRQSLMICPPLNIVGNIGFGAPKVISKQSLLNGFKTGAMKQLGKGRWSCADAWVRRSMDARRCSSLRGRAMRW